MRKTAAALLFSLLMMAPGRSFAGAYVSVGVAPPPLVEYEQPLVPGPGYIWTPGYWAYDEDGWFWVAGAWVLPPEPGLLWTPGYWDYDDYAGVYLWHAGYWGPHVGFYGGIDYGYGYTGYGYYGGYWDHGAFWYNSSCSHVDRRYIHNTYSKVVVVSKTTTVSRVSYNGGPGREKFEPTRADLQSRRERHVSPTVDQLKHQKIAMTSKETHFSVNRGRPAVAAVTRAGDFPPNGPSAKTVPTVRSFSARSAPGDLKPSNGGPAGPNAPRVVSNDHDAPDIQRGLRPDDPRRESRVERFTGRPDPRLTGGFERGHGAGRSASARVDKEQDLDKEQRLARSLPRRRPQNQNQMQNQRWPR